MRLKIIIVDTLLLSLLTFIPISAFSQNDKEVVEQGYLITKIGADDSQAHLLDSILNIRMPDTIQTVGAAVEYILSQYGYSLGIEEGIHEEQYVLLVKALPQPHREFEVVSVREILIVLAGGVYDLYVNPVSRTITYILKDEYAHYLPQSDIDAAKSIWYTTNKKTLHVSYKDSVSDFTDYGTVKKGESLVGIVRRLGFKDISVEQALSMLYKANRHAFAADNMNYLLAGKKLSIPLYDNEWLISPIEAKLLVKAHHEEWVSLRSRP